MADTTITLNFTEMELFHILQGLDARSRLFMEKAMIQDQESPEDKDLHKRVAKSYKELARRIRTEIGANVTAD